MELADLKAVRQGEKAMANDLYNLQLRVAQLEAASASPQPESKVWSYSGALNHRVLVDRRDPQPFARDNPRYTASSWRVGERATEINPITGQHSYNTGNLYRTVHWTDDSFGLNGRFTNEMGKSGPWRAEGLNVSQAKSHVLPNPSQWGSQKYATFLGI